MTEVYRRLTETFLLQSIQSTDGYAFKPLLDLII